MDDLQHSVTVWMIRDKMNCQNIVTIEGQQIKGLSFVHIAAAPAQCTRRRFRCERTFKVCRCGSVHITGLLAVGEKSQE